MIKHLTPLVLLLFMTPAVAQVEKKLKVKTTDQDKTYVASEISAKAGGYKTLLLSKVIFISPLAVSLYT